MILSPVQRALNNISWANLIVGSDHVTKIISNYFSEIMRYDNMVRTLYESMVYRNNSRRICVSVSAAYLFLYIHPGPYGRVALFFHCIRTKSEIKKIACNNENRRQLITYTLHSRVAHFLLFCQKKYSDYCTARYNVFVCCSRSVRKILLVYPDVPQVSQW